MSSLGSGQPREIVVRFSLSCSSPSSRWTFVTLFEASSNKPLVAAQPSGITTNDRSSTSNDETTDSIAAEEEVIVVVACLYSRNSQDSGKYWKKRSSRTRKLCDCRVLLVILTAEAEITLSGFENTDFDDHGGGRLDGHGVVAGRLVVVA